MYGSIAPSLTWQSHAIAHKLQPDTMLVASNCTLMLEEDKLTNLAAAYANIGRKRDDLSGMQYGPIKLCWALQQLGLYCNGVFY